MHHLYHTPAFILGGAPLGEGSRHLTLFTREFGLILARAQGVREERSKLRYGLQPFMFSSVTLVRGKEVWRVTGVMVIEDLSAVFWDRRECVELFSRVFRLLRRLLAGEEKNERLFDSLTEAVLFLKESPLPPEKLASVEVVLLLRILHALGYLAPRGEFSAFLDETLHWGDAVLEQASSLRALALADINHSLRESQL